VIGRRRTVAGWAAIGAGAAFVVTYASAATRTLRPTLEARAYAHDIRRATDGAVHHLRALAHLEQTRDASRSLARTLQPAGEAQR
jgi:hypothetical protein